MGAKSAENESKRAGGTPRLGRGRGDPCCVLLGPGLWESLGGGGEGYDT